MLGSTIILEVGSRTIQRDVLPGQSYLAASDPRVHVGLGAPEGVRRVRVRWVDGEVEAFGDFDAGAYHEIVRGRGARP